MFARVKDFLYRHRRKFLIGGVVIGGGALLSHYAEKKLLEWHDRQTRMLVERQKKRQHYENTVRTSCATVLSLSGSMKEVIARELDADALLQALRDQPQHKRSIWEQLKVVGFSRAAAAVYVGSMVSAAIRVQLMLLGGYTFGELINTSQSSTPITQTLQQKYLAAVHYLVEQGIPRLVAHVTKAVTHLTTGLPLNRALTLSQLEAIFHEIRLTLAGEGAEQDTSAQEKRLKVEPWSRYVLQPPLPPEGDSEDDRILYNMLVETTDILDSEDFNSVMDTLIQHGINLLLDRMAEFYPMPKVNEEGNIPSENWVDNISRDATANMGDPTSQTSPSSPGAAAASPPPPPPPPPPQYSALSNSSLPVAKMVPVVSGIVHGALSPVPGQLLQKVLSNDKLDTLGANVYEAFAVPRTQ